MLALVLAICRSSLASCARRRHRVARSLAPAFFDTLYTYAWFVTFALVPACI